MPYRNSSKDVQKEIVALFATESAVMPRPSSFDSDPVIIMQANEHF